jgi:ubiquinone/menaquinone biosynthesis C-methylase UbiE
MRREVIPELLDDDLGTPKEIADSLVDLRHINDWFGGTRTTVTLVEQVAKRCASRELSLLEVGAGGGDLPLRVGRILAGKGIRMQATLLDRMWSHLPRNGARSVAGDALALPFRDEAFDVVSCSLFAHHLEPEELRAYVREALRVCRRGVLINDLIRSRLHLGLVFAGLPLFRSRVTWHDAPASVRRAYTCKEMEEILQDVQAAQVEISRHYLYRMGVVVWKEHLVVRM